MYYDLTKGRIGKCLILFALPMIAGNLLQQFYNIADTLIVGRALKLDPADVAFLISADLFACGIRRTCSPAES